MGIFRPIVRYILICIHPMGWGRCILADMENWLHICKPKRKTILIFRGLKYVSIHQQMKFFREAIHTFCDLCKLMVYDMWFDSNQTPHSLTQFSLTKYGRTKTGKFTHTSRFYRESSGRAIFLLGIPKVIFYILYFLLKGKPLFLRKIPQ